MCKLEYRDRFSKVRKNVIKKCVYDTLYLTEVLGIYIYIKTIN